MKPIIYTLAILATIALYGCASLQNAGTASYKVQPFSDGNGGIVCCSVDVENGKEIAVLKAHIAKTAAGDYTVDLEEQGVAAFQGQAISAGALKQAVDDALKAALAAGAVVAVPVLAPAAGAALAAPGIGAAALGAAGILGVQAVQPAAPKP